MLQLHLLLYNLQFVRQQSSLFIVTYEHVWCLRTPFRSVWIVIEPLVVHVCVPTGVCSNARDFPFVYAITSDK